MNKEKRKVISMNRASASYIYKNLKHDLNPNISI